MIWKQNATHCPVSDIPVDGDWIRHLERRKARTGYGRHPDRHGLDGSGSALFIPAHFATVDTGHLAIDLFAATSTISLAIVAHRFWPMSAAVLQILPLLAHFSRALDLSMHPIAYLTMQVASSWLLPPLLALGTWRHRLRLQRNGSDPSWQTSLKLSNRSMGAS